MATAQHLCRAQASAAASSHSAPVREPASSGASCTRCSASSPSAPSSSSTCSRTLKRSRAPSPMARRSSSSTACRWCACSSGSSSSCPSSITPSTASTSGCAASPTSSTTPGPATGCTSPSATPASSPSSTSSSTSIASASWDQAARESLRSLPKVQVELANPWMLAVYVIAMIAICWHFAYGIWLFAAKWGITPGEKSRASASAMSAWPSAFCSASWGSPASGPSSAASIPTFLKTRSPAVSTAQPADISF